MLVLAISKKIPLYVPPFNEKILSDFLFSIRKKVCIIYNNPVHKQVLINEGFDMLTSK